MKGLRDMAAYWKDMNQDGPEYVMSEINNIYSDDAATVDTGITCVVAICKTTGKHTVLRNLDVLWQTSTGQKLRHWPCATASDAQLV